MSENKNVPELRFPGFDGEWERTSLGKLGQLVSGLTYSPENIVSNGLLVLRSSNILDSQINLLDSVFVDIEVDDKFLSQKNDILICVRNGSKRLIGKNAIIPSNIPKATHGAFMSVFRGNNNSYVYQWMQTKSYFKEVYKNLGATINSINGADLKKFPLSIPKQKSEAQKISDFLSTVDKKIEQLTEKHRLLTEYKKGVMQQIFSQQIRFKDDEGNEYPEWQKVKFSNLFTFLKTNALSRADLVEDGEVKNIHYGDIHTRLPSQTRIEKIWLPFIAKHIDLSKLEDALCLDGDLVVADASEDYLDIGKAIELSGIAESNNKVVAGLHTFLARPDKSKIAKGYSGYVMQIDVVRKQIMRLATGVSVLGISKTNIGKVVLPIPCLEEQQKIADFLTAIDNKIDQAWLKLEQTKAFKKGLLQKMFV